MQKALTDKTIEALKPQDKRYEVHDLRCPGMSVRVERSGRRTFNIKFRFGLKQKRMKLGTYPRISLATAREKAIELLRQVDEGIDPTKRRRSPNMTVEAVCRQFITLHAKARNRSWREAERILEREFIAQFGERDIRQIKRYDVLEILDAAVARGAGYQANRILAHVRKLFSWSIERGILEVSPINGLKSPTIEKSRERVLSDDEIARILLACKNEVYPSRYFIPLLLATAQRRGELAQMRWSEVDFDAKTWVIPGSRAKNGHCHVVPLNDFALSMLREVPRFVDTDLVFTTTHNSPLSGFTKMRRRISERSQTSDWRIHDLRRTAASGMASATVDPHVIEKILNHVGSTMSTVALTYNRYGYDFEKRQALNLWGERLNELNQRTTPFQLK